MDRDLPLNGVRVVEAVGECGELGARLLADLGADVIRVEPPGGAPSRGAPPVHDGVSLAWAVRNANKRIVTLDVSVPADRAVLDALLADADILVETRRPGTTGELGIDAAELAAAFPRLVVTTISDFGQTGPYRDFEATDPVLIAVSGSLYRAGIPELPPVLTPARMAHDIAGIVAAFAALLGYWQRLATGRGQRLDVSALEANAQTTDWGLTTFGVGGGSVAYGEIRSGAGPVYPLVRCADGWVRPSIVTPSEWAAMRRWMGADVDLGDDIWATAASRAGIRDELAAMYGVFFSDKGKITLAEDGQRHRMTITPMLEPDEVLAAAHFGALGTFIPVDAGTGRAAPVPSGFLEVDGRRAGWRAAAEESSATPAWSARSAERARTPGPPGAPPLAGVRVLDFGVAGAAPEIGRLFAEYGADVITVESRDHPDLFRVIMGTEFSPPFVSSNRSKRSFGVDARHPEARAVLDELVRRSDVIVENLPRGSMERLGLGWEDVARINPRVVMVSSQLMGTRGPWRDWRGYGSNTQPVAGLTSLWSHPGLDEPVGANVALPDHIVGRLGAMAAVAGLIGRVAGDRGAHVEIAQVEVVVNLLAELFAKAALEPGSIGPQGNRSDRGAPWGVYPCAGTQRWCVITCRDDDEWRRLRAALGDPAWADAPEWDDVGWRRAHHDELDAELASWTSQRTDREVMEHLQAHRVAAGMMAYPSDQPTDPHLVARGYVRTLEQPGMGALLVEGPSFTGTDLADVTIGPAPRLGEHTRAICADLLGLSPSRVDELIAAGALFVPVG